ncbi:piggyBac transposable element-derived protein 4-like [Osmerus mordax]|uniref:piggyBac transposable element-derived protein 4-like n=1 Tax=Osmerus mordax TaxID=8014 RepID=UPI00350EB360
MSVNPRKRKQLTDDEIKQIFLDSDNEGDFKNESSCSESDDDGLPDNLAAIVKTEPEDACDVPDDDGGREPVASGGVEQVSSRSWRPARNFTPPGPEVVFEKQHCGVQIHPESQTEAQCFKMLLTEELVQHIVKATNNYALQLKKNVAPGVKGKLAKWQPTTVDEMYSFLVVILLMGIVKKSALRDYWSTDPMVMTPFFTSLFSQDRFLVLLRCLHFVDEEIENVSDPLYKIRDVQSGLISAFNRVFVPYRDLCIDESLMLWKGRLAFKQYIPRKKHRIGVKFFLLCDVLTGYVQDLIIYTGLTSDVKYHEGLGIAGSVVMTLLTPHLGKGHCLYVDNWYTNPTLFQHLLSLGTGACGTVRANRKGMPAFTSKMSKGDVEFKENGNQLAVKWHDKREVHLLSTIHKSTMSPTKKRDYTTGEKRIKPTCVVEYNKKMGAVDKSDMLNSFVECIRKTTKWYKKIFFHLIDTAVLNSYIVHRKLSGKVIPYRDFRIQLMKELLMDHHVARCRSVGGRPSIDTPLRLKARHFPSEIPQTANQGRKTRRQCKVCQTSTRRKQRRHVTKYQCEPCKTALCAFPCFEEYHTLKHF